MTTKPRWSLLPFNELEQIVKVLTHGAEKYSDYGWTEVSVKEHFDALIRHISERKKGNFNDKETALPHLAHAACRLIFIMFLDRYHLSDDPQADRIHPFFPEDLRNPFVP